MKIQMPMRMRSGRVRFTPRLVATALLALACTDQPLAPTRRAVPTTPRAGISGAMVLNGITDLGALVAGGISQATGINASGQVAGHATITSSGPTRVVR